MIICIHTVCRERWKPSISSQFYSAFPIKPPLFTFSVSAQSLPISARQLLYSPLVRIWETLLWTKCENKCFVFFPLLLSSNAVGLWSAPEVAVMDVRSHKLKCHPLSLNPRWKSDTPARRWNTSDALICSLMLLWFCPGPRHDACLPH